MHIVAPLFQFVNSHPALTKEEFSNMHSIYNGACPTSRVLIDNFLGKADKFILIQEGYGMTELSPLSHMIARDSKNSKIGSVGPPIPNTLVKVICPETGNSLGPQEKGELWIKGPQVSAKMTTNDQGLGANRLKSTFLQTRSNNDIKILGTGMSILK